MDRETDRKDRDAGQMAQASETHATTDDAASSPASDEKQGLEGLGRTGPGETIERDPSRTQVDELLGTVGGHPGETPEERKKLFPEGVKVKQDDSDAGGPIVIETDLV